jgi:FkbM family methyltransferase
MYNLGNYIVPEDCQNGICFDIGCNLGDFSFKYKDFFNKIYYIEPQINLFNSLQNKLNYENLIGYNLAVHNVSDLSLTLIQHKSFDHGSVAVKNNDINDEWTDQIVNIVKSISLEDFLIKTSEKNIDYLKIDCETSEYNFLFGKNLEMFKYIGIEIHHQMGIDRYMSLTNWIKNTHKAIFGDYSYTIGVNKELLFKRI